jgi:hypothetical protein
MNKCQERRLRVVSRKPACGVRRVLSGRGTGEGVAVQRCSISAGLAIKPAEYILLPPHYEKTYARCHIISSRPPHEDEFHDDGVAQFIGATSLMRLETNVEA